MRRRCPGIGFKQSPSCPDSRTSAPPAPVTSSIKKARNGARRDRDGRPRKRPIEIVTADIGGTHARFAIAEVENGCVVSLASLRR
jgi:hypothetical protein